MPKTCSIGLCKSRAYTSCGIKFYDFPPHAKQPERRLLWANRCERMTLDGRSWQPNPASRSVYVCSKHFTTGTPYKIPTHPDYAPNVNLPSQKNFAESSGRFNSESAGAMICPTVSFTQSHQTIATSSYPETIAVTSECEVPVTSVKEVYDNMQEPTAFLGSTKCWMTASAATTAAAPITGSAAITASAPITGRAATTAAAPITGRAATTAAAPITGRAVIRKKRKKSWEKLFVRKKRRGAHRRAVDHTEQPRMPQTTIIAPIVIEPIDEVLDIKTEEIKIENVNINTFLRAGSTTAIDEPGMMNSGTPDLKTPHASWMNSGATNPTPHTIWMNSGVPTVQTLGATGANIDAHGFHPTDTLLQSDASEAHGLYPTNTLLKLKAMWKRRRKPKSKCFTRKKGSRRAAASLVDCRWRTSRGSGAKFGSKFQALQTMNQKRVRYSTNVAPIVIQPAHVKEEVKTEKGIKKEVACTCWNPVETSPVTTIKIEPLDGCLQTSMTTTHKIKTEGVTSSGEQQTLKVELESLESKPGLLNYECEPKPDLLSFDSNIKSDLSDLGYEVNPGLLGLSYEPNHDFQGPGNKSKPTYT